jgi:hypothetical protein
MIRIAPKRGGEPTYCKIASTCRAPALQVNVASRVDNPACERAAARTRPVLAEEPIPHGSACRFGTEVHLGNQTQVVPFAGGTVGTEGLA